MSSILIQIYRDLSSNNHTEYIEMEQCVPWSGIDKKDKKKYIISYMKSNSIEGDISMYTFKDISFNKTERKITNLTYYRKK